MSFNPTDEQKEVINTWGKGVAVLAGAGCGKTSTLVEKCKELVRKNPDAVLCAVTFTERSASDLRRKLQKELPDFSKHWITTIHGLCGLISRSFPFEAGMDGDEEVGQQVEIDMLWEKSLDCIWMESLPSEVSDALDLLSDREGRASIVGLIERFKTLNHFGADFSKVGESGTNALHSLSILSLHVLNRYRKEKQEKGISDFDDLERFAAQALSSKKVARFFHQKFDLVLVDEFQDTNPIQGEIIQRLVKPSLENLVIVGDPKQSIYRFRDADLSVFEEYCSQLPVVCHLTQNFRSRPEIIEFVNTVCEPLFESSKLDYTGLVSTREAHPEGRALSQLRVSSPKDLGAAILGLEKSGVCLENVALLLRKIRGNEQWIQALVSSGISIAMGSGGFFWEDPRVKECIALLNWWVEPSNEFSGAVFLRSPLCQLGVSSELLSDDTIHSWVQSKDSLWDQFFSSGHPVAKSLNLIRGRPSRPGEVLLQLFESENAAELEAEYGVALMQLWHKCESFSSNGLGFYEVILELKKALRDGRRERDLPPPKSKGQLQVLTVHSSKGLEFEKVILLDFPLKKARSRPSPLLYWDRKNGVYLGNRDDRGQRMPKDKIEMPWKDRERFAELNESKRLFYVALTRAIDEMMIVVPEADLTLGKGIDDAYVSDYWRAWISPGESKLIEIESKKDEQLSLFSSNDTKNENRTSGLKNRETLKEVLKVRPRLSVTDWANFLKCSQRYAYEIFDPRPSEPDPFFATLGTSVHRALEFGDFNELEELESKYGSNRFKASHVKDWWSVSPHSAGLAGPDSEKEISFEIPFYLKDIDGNEIRQNFVGTIDALYFDEGKESWTIVDYKTVQRLATPDEIEKRYRNQMTLYALAVASMGSVELSNVRGVLVQFSPEGYRETEIAFPNAKQVEQDLRESLVELRRVHQIGSGSTRPGDYCRACSHSDICTALN